MILFYGRGDDRPLELAVRAAAGQGLDFWLVDVRHLDVHDVVLELGRPGGPGIGGVLTRGRQPIDLAGVRAVYARPLAPTVAPHDPEARRVHAVHTLLLTWMDAAPCLVVNRPSAMAGNGSKPFQAQLIAEAGFEVPETLVTDDPSIVRAFLAEHGRVVFKSVSGIRSIVRELDGDALARLDRVRALPTQFQAYVPGTDVRVHVVGSTTFATAVHSDATDYRYARRDGRAARLEAVELPAHVAARCAALARRLGLPLCGIDLRRTPDERWVCFEANPMPAYSWFEDETGAPISEALATLLGAAPRPTDGTVPGATATPEVSPCR